MTNDYMSADSGMWFNPRGEPISLHEAESLLADVNARRVAEAIITYDDGDLARTVRVSTVFLALNHQFVNGPPILWETMVFGGPTDGDMDRYASVLAALGGHHSVLTLALTALDNAGKTVTKVEGHEGPAALSLTYKPPPITRPTPRAIEHKRGDS